MTNLQHKANSNIKVVESISFIPMLPGAIGIFELHREIMKGTWSFLYSGPAMKAHQLYLNEQLL